MGCNGYNHPLDCNCGWGGVFHPTADGLTYGPGYWSREASYFNPNAKCPVCRSAVFFYRSPDNGRVFFDHPGPPWPKHPCTARDQQNIGITKTGLDAKEGWFPFPCKAILKKAGEVTELIHAQDRSLFIHHDAERLDLESPIWIRQVERQKKLYEVSLLSIVKGVMQPARLLAFGDLNDLIRTVGQSLNLDPLSGKVMDQGRNAEVSKLKIGSVKRTLISKPVVREPKPLLKFQEQKSRKEISQIMKSIEEKQDTSIIAQAFGEFAKNQNELVNLVEGLKRKK